MRHPAQQTGRMSNEWTNCQSKVSAQKGKKSNWHLSIFQFLFPIWLRGKLYPCCTHWVALKVCLVVCVWRPHFLHVTATATTRTIARKPFSLAPSGIQELISFYCHSATSAVWFQCLCKCVATSLLVQWVYMLLSIYTHPHTLTHTHTHTGTDRMATVLCFKASIDFEPHIEHKQRKRTLCCICATQSQSQSCNKALQVCTWPHGHTHSFAPGEACPN